MIHYNITYETMSVTDTGEAIIGAVFIGAYANKENRVLITVPHHACLPQTDLREDLACDHYSLKRAKELREKLASKGFEVDIITCDLVRKTDSNLEDDMRRHDCNRINRDPTNDSVQRTNRAIKEGGYALLLDVHTFFDLERAPYILQRIDNPFISRDSKGFEFLNVGDEYADLHDRTKLTTPMTMDTVKVVDATEKNYNLKLAKEWKLPAVLIEFHGTDDENDHTLMDTLIQYIVANIHSS